jgi:nicotinate-nucleotide adenylyltransferase
MKIAIFSGSFDPPHIGHLAVAEYLFQHEHFDEVWFTVTPHNPLKEKQALSQIATRLEMTKLAVKGHQGFCICDIECSLPQPSYTINTLTALSEQFPQDEFTLIIGADNWENMKHWKEYERIIKEYNIMIYPRKGYEVKIPEQYPKSRFINAPEVEVSSTEIRQAVAKGNEVLSFLPKNVYEYIKSHKLYTHEDSSSSIPG